MPATQPMFDPSATRCAGLVAVDGRAYPLRSVDLEARAEGGVALTTLTQTYENPYDEPLEVLYTLPLPADGAVVGYAIHLGPRVIRGEVRRREEAREEYRKALLEGRTAGLLEQDRDDTFQQKLGCLPAGETARVEIEVLQPLAFEPAADEARSRWLYRFPTVVGVRYEGEPDRVPDADRLDVDRAAGEGTPARVELRMVVADDGPDKLAPRSPSHAIACSPDDAGTRIVLKEGERLDRDLVVDWVVAGDEVGVRLVEGPGLPGDDGRYGLLTLTPPQVSKRSFARDLTILIDASGSMMDAPIRQAKAVAADLLESLEPSDRFEILAFATDVRHLTRGMTEASPRKVRAARSALEQLEAGGATEMTRAMVEALQPLREESQRQVVLITDGYIGFEAEVIGQVLDRLPDGARVHTVGIGASPNRTLTRGVARAGRGVELFVGDEDSARPVAKRLRQATVRPVLTDLRLEGQALRGVAPQRPRDVLAGQPLVLAAELSSAGGSIVVRGRLAGQPASWERTLHVPAAIESGDSSVPIALGALYGREAIADCELRLSASRTGDVDCFERRIESLGLRHRIASRRTSLVAVAEEPSVDPKAPRRRERLPVELPAGASAEGLGLIADSAAATLLQFPRAMDSLALGVVAPGVRKPRATRASRSVEPGLRIDGARVLHQRDRLLVVEFEIPVSGMLLPRGKIEVEFAGVGEEWVAKVVHGESTPRGPHERGVTVRLALLLQKETSWSDPDIVIAWNGRSRRDGLYAPLGRVTIPLQIPESPRK